MQHVNMMMLSGDDKLEILFHHAAMHQSDLVQYED